MSSYPWMQVSYEDICRLLQTDPRWGLSIREAERRLHEKGRMFCRKKKISLLPLFLKCNSGFYGFSVVSAPSSCLPCLGNTAML